MQNENSSHDTGATEPMFCPNQACIYHHRSEAEGVVWYIRFGSFPTKARGLISRFRCRKCGKTCSTQTFSVHYWTHSTTDLRHLQGQLTSASGLRQIGRLNGYSYRVVKNRTHRLARQYLTLYSHALELHAFNEPLTIHSIRSRLRSRYFPVNINVLVGFTSQACYGFNLAVTRRSGRISNHERKIQKRIDAVWRPDRRSLENGTHRLITDFLPHIDRTIEQRPLLSIFSNANIRYARALKRIPLIRSAMAERKIIHRRITERIKRSIYANNHLFSAEYIEREVRKDMGDHSLESVKHARELHCALERLVIKLGSHSFAKPYRIAGKVHDEDEPRHFEIAGMDQTSHVVNYESWMFSDRQVFSHLPPDIQKTKWIRTIWMRTGENPPIIDKKTNDEITGKPKLKARPMERYFANHLLA